MTGFRLTSSRQNVNLWVVPVKMSLAALVLFAITITPDMLAAYLAVSEERTNRVSLRRNSGLDGPSVGFGGSNGPWRGGFNTPPSEGSMRVPAMVRWPGKIPAGVVTEEMLSCHDWYKTFAALAGALDKVRIDRRMDGVDASQFVLGQSKTTGRDSLVFFGPDGSMMSAKAHNIKIWMRFSEGFDQPIVKPQFPIVYDLGSDPGERANLFFDKMDIGWEAAIVLPAVFEYVKSFAQYPNIKPGEEFKGYKPSLVKSA